MTACAARDGLQISQRPGGEELQRERSLLLDVDACAAVAVKELGYPVGVYLFTHARADRGKGEPLPGRAHLVRLAVDPGQWGRGIGQALVPTRSEPPVRAGTSTWSFQFEKRTPGLELFTNCAGGSRRAITTVTLMGVP